MERVSSADINRACFLDPCWKGQCAALTREAWAELPCDSRDGQSPDGTVLKFQHCTIDQALRQAVSAVRLLRLLLELSCLVASLHSSSGSSSSGCHSCTMLICRCWRLALLDSAEPHTCFCRMLEMSETKCWLLYGLCK